MNCYSTGQPKGTYVKSYSYKTMRAKPAKPRRVVLIVEDEPLVRVTSADLLAEAGFEVLEAGGRFLPKPCDGQALVRQIEEIVNQ